MDVLSRRATFFVCMRWSAQGFSSGPGRKHAAGDASDGLPCVGCGTGQPDQPLSRQLRAMCCGTS
jgi:hypothetical protein